jgi:hypothetical protein
VMQITVGIRPRAVVVAVIVAAAGWRAGPEYPCSADGVREQVRPAEPGAARGVHQQDPADPLPPAIAVREV